MVEIVIKLINILRNLHFPNLHKQISSLLMPGKWKLWKPWPIWLILGSFFPSLLKINKHFPHFSDFLLAQVFVLLLRRTKIIHFYCRNYNEEYNWVYSWALLCTAMIIYDCLCMTSTPITSMNVQAQPLTFFSFSAAHFPTHILIISPCHIT